MGYNTRVTHCTLSQSLKAYLRTIYFISRKQDTVRVKDVAAALQVTSASVTEALSSLIKSDLIEHKPYRTIALTPNGFVMTQEILHHQRALFDFFYDILGMNESEAHDIVSRVGEAMSSDSATRMNALVKKLKSNKAILGLPNIRVPLNEACVRQTRCTMCKYYTSMITGNEL